MKKITLFISLTAFSWFSFSQTAIFNYTGSVQTFVVPAFVTSVNIDASGAAGSQDGAGLGTAGKGGRVQASLAVTPGETLYVYVGGAGAAPNGGFNGGGNGGTSSIGPPGGGGGGMSDIRQGGNLSSDIVVAAAGGGGCGGYNGVDGGDGGGILGQPGTDGAATGGLGGTQIAGGLAGTGAGNCGLAGTAGTQWTGGAGGNTTCGNGFGGGGGGGGSSYVDSSVASLIVHTTGYQSGNGQVSISYIITGTVTIVNADNGIILYPNPAASELVIKSSELGDKSEIEIYDVMGKKVFPSPLVPLSSRRGDERGEVIIISSLSSGIYFVKMKTKDRIRSAKFLKE